MDHPLLQTGADRYVVVSRIAEGGMGAIFLGKKVGIGGFEKVVVLKQLLPEFTSRAEFIDLFLREARLSASLDHANIVHTIDLVTAGADYFIVMEFVDGGDVRTITRRIKLRGRQLLPAAGLFIAREVLAALGYAHDKKGPDGSPLKLIHRDVSPSNIMISAAGQVKLADFGIAKASTHKSVFYRVKGKVGYMSPEQAFANRPLDHRSDLYSLAVIFYELLAGERLFVADLLSIPDQIYKQPVPPLEGTRDMPAGVDAVLRRSLALDPDDRYQTAHEFLDALLQVTLENHILFGGADLAAHLREVCGPDPSTWNSEQPEEEQEERPGTMLLEDEDEGEGENPYTGVELTSMMTVAGKLGSIAQGRAAADPAAAPGSGYEPPPTLDGEETGAWERPKETEDDFWGEQETVAFASTGRPPDLPPPTDHSPRTGPESAVSERLLRRQERPPRERGRGHTPIHHSSARVAQPLDDGGPKPIRRPPLRRKRGPLHSTARVSSRRGQRLTVIAALLLLLTAVAIIVAVGLCGPSAVEPEGGPDARLPFSEGRSDARPAPADGARLDAAPADAPIATDGPATPDAQRPDARETDATGATGAPPAADRTITIESRPGRAAVFLDGVRQCRTRCRIKGLDPQRLYLLSVRRRGFVGWSRLIDPLKQPEIDVKARLSREPPSRKVGYLVVRPTTPAEVSVDGVRINHVTSEGRIPLRPGRHEVTLTHPKKERVIRFMVTIFRQRITTTERMTF